MLLTQASMLSENENKIKTAGISFVNKPTLPTASTSGYIFTSTTPKAISQMVLGFLI